MRPLLENTSISNEPAHRSTQERAEVISGARQLLGLPDQALVSQRGEETSAVGTDTNSLSISNHCIAQHFDRHS
jgi:hypothetical protein